MNEKTIAERTLKAGGEVVAVTFVGVRTEDDTAVLGKAGVLKLYEVTTTVTIEKAVIGTFKVVRSGVDVDVLVSNVLERLVVKNVKRTDESTREFTVDRKAGLEELGQFEVFSEEVYVATGRRVAWVNLTW